MSWSRRVSWLESSWCQKLIEHIKIFLYPKFERKRIYKERYVEALWFFNKVVWSVLAAMLEGILSQVFSIAKRNTVVVRHFLFFMNISQKIYLPSQLWSEPILLPGLTREALTKRSNLYAAKDYNTYWSKRKFSKYTISITILSTVSA